MRGRWWRSCPLWTADWSIVSGDRHLRTSARTAPVSDHVISTCSSRIPPQIDPTQPPPCPVVTLSSCGASRISLCTRIYVYISVVTTSASRHLVAAYLFADPLPGFSLAPCPYFPSTVPPLLPLPRRGFHHPSPTTAPSPDRRGRRSRIHLPLHRTPTEQDLPRCRLLVLLPSARAGSRSQMRARARGRLFCGAAPACGSGVTMSRNGRCAGGAQRGAV